MQDQQRFYNLIMTMLSPNVKKGLRATKSLRNPKDMNCGSKLLKNAYRQMVNKGNAARRKLLDEADKLISGPLLRVRAAATWDLRKIAIRDRMATH